MVLRTLVKLDSKMYPKVDWFMPGYCKKSLKHHSSIIPLYVFTVAGCFGCAFYCYKLLAYQDTGLLKGNSRAEVQQNEKIPLIAIPEVVNYKTHTFPSSRPEL